MRTHGLWFSASLVGVIVSTASVAVGRTDDTETPLVVAVEMGPGGGSDLGQVRGVIGRELGRPIVAFVDGAPAESGGTDEPDLLLVGLSRERIVMSLRRRREATVARSVPAPADAAARLRTIAWLAGNVVRDQISPFLRASTELGKGGLLVADVTASSEAAPPVPTPPQPAATEPPPIAPPPLPVGAAVETLARNAPPAPPRLEAEWSVALAAGPGFYYQDQSPIQRSVAIQVEVLKHRPDRWLWGVGADLGPGSEVGAGLAVLGGSEWRWGKTRLEAHLGLGMEGVSMHSIKTSVGTDASGMPTSSTADVVSTAYVAYTRGFVTLSRELTRTWDVVFRVGVNYFGRIPSVSSGVGLRLNLM